MYSRNNPVSYYDDNGKFDVSTHMQITQQAIEAVGELGFLNMGGLIVKLGVAAVDGYNVNKSEQHYDNSNFKGGDNFVKSNLATGDYYDLSEALHTRQDFYSHSNYVELAIKIFGEENLPIFHDAMKNKGFAEFWAKEGKSGNFPNKDDDPYSHEKMNQDTPRKQFYSKAKALATQETILILSNWKYENEK